MRTVWICLLRSGNSWFGETTVHSTWESARRFVRHEQINDLVDFDLPRDEVEALDDDALHELWEAETEQLVLCEEVEVLDS